MDILMNANGVKVDKLLVDSVLRIDAESTEKLTDEARKITGLDNPNSITQLKSWVESQLVEDLPGLTKMIYQTFYLEKTYL